MNADTFRTALRAAGALTGIGVVACTSPPPPKAPSPPKVDCVALTDKAFNGNDDYHYPAQPLPPNLDPAVAACCNAGMRSDSGPNDSNVFWRHRWRCCDVATVPAQPASNCIPWGPPVPPPMARRRERAREVA